MSVAKHRHQQVKRTASKDLSDVCKNVWCARISRGKLICRALFIDMLQQASGEPGDHNTPLGYFPHMVMSIHFSELSYDRPAVNRFAADAAAAVFFSQAMDKGQRTVLSSVEREAVVHVPCHVCISIGVCTRCACAHMCACILRDAQRCLGKKSDRSKKRSKDRASDGSSDLDRALREMFTDLAQLPKPSAQIVNGNRRVGCCICNYREFNVWDAVLFA